VGAQTSRGGLRTVTVLAVACMPLAFYADVLEVALPVTLVQTLHASPAWSSGIFVGNTVLVIVLQVIVVVGLSGRSHRTVLAASGLVLAGSYLGFWLGAAWGGPPGVIVVAAVALPYTMGEILYTGSSVPLVIESAPTQLTGRALARWQLSYGLARAADPIIITGLLAISAAALWVPLTAATLLSAAAIALSGRAARPPARRPPHVRDDCPRQRCGSQDRQRAAWPREHDRDGSDLHAQVDRKRCCGGCEDRGNDLQSVREDLAWLHSWLHQATKRPLRSSLRGRFPW
jgi:hypothetical protein